MLTRLKTTFSLEGVLYVVNGKAALSVDSATYNAIDLPVLLSKYNSYPQLNTTACDVQ